MRNDISTEHAMIATQRVMRSFGDLIGGRPDIMERIVFRVITGDLVIESDDEEEGNFAPQGREQFSKKSTAFSLLPSGYFPSGPLEY